MTILWFVVVLVLAFIELITVNLVTVWFVASALVSLFLSFFDVSTQIQVAVFVILGIVLLITTRKQLVKMVNSNRTRTNLDRVLDMVGIVTEDIDKDIIGEVKVDGKRWSAVASEKIKKDEKVKILKIDGVKLIVERIDE